jgi:two-component system, NarL family, captular synthesis response regulator RcsB
MTDLPIRVLVADDHPALVLGVRHELAHITRISLVGAAANSTELVSVLSEKACDVLVTDYAMPGGGYGDGVSMVAFLKRHFPHVRIVVFTMMDNPAVFRSLIDEGVHCILSKADSTRHVLYAIYAACQGKAYFSPAIKSVVEALDTSPARRKRNNNMLSPRELEVVRLYVSGLSVNEIAEILHRSKQTVSSQKRHAMTKLGVQRNADLIKYLMDSGLESPRIAAG